MEKRIVAAIAGIVWLSAVASAAALSYTLNRPLVTFHGSSLRSPLTPGETQLRPSADEMIESSVLELPTVTIVGELPSTASSRRNGAAEMQRTDDVIIGPGVVTHP